MRQRYMRPCQARKGAAVSGVTLGATGSLSSSGDLRHLLKEGPSSTALFPTFSSYRIINHDKPYISGPAVPSGESLPCPEIKRRTGRTSSQEPEAQCSQVEGGLGNRREVPVPRRRLHEVAGGRRDSARGRGSRDAPNSLAEALALAAWRRRLNEKAGAASRIRR